MQSKPKPKKIITKVIKRKPSIKGKTPAVQEPDNSPRTSKIPHSPSSAKICRSLKKAKTSHIPKAESSSDEDDSFDSINFKIQTAEVKTQIIKSLQLFKLASQEYITQNTLLEKEVENFEVEFDQVKTEVSEILMESSKSKLELCEIKKKFQRSTEAEEIQRSRRNSAKCERFKEEQVKQVEVPEESLDLEVSERNGENRVVLRQRVEEIRREVRDIKIQLENGEEEIRETEIENTELRNITFKLKENLCSEPLSLEYGDQRVGCKSCWIF